MNFASDPILGQQTAPIDPMVQLNDWKQKYAELQNQQRNLTMQPQQSQTPTWDEIDKIMDSLTDSQRAFLDQNRDFADSYQIVANIFQREELRIVRPLVERTKDGREALERHLALIKKLHKDAKQAEEEKTALWNEYITNYSDMTFNDFMVKIKGKKGEKK